MDTHQIDMDLNQIGLIFCLVLFILAPIIAALTALISKPKNYPLIKYGTPDKNCPSCYGTGKLKRCNCPCTINIYYD